MRSITRLFAALGTLADSILALAGVLDIATANYGNNWPSRPSRYWSISPVSRKQLKRGFQLNLPRSAAARVPEKTPWIGGGVLPGGPAA
jgi:hypothetical protein